MRAADGGPDQPQASSQCRIRPERQVLYLDYALIYHLAQFEIDEVEGWTRMG